MVATIETQLLKIQRLDIFRMFSRKQDIYIIPLPTVKVLTGSVSEWEGEQGQREKVISECDRISHHINSHGWLHKTYIRSNQILFQHGIGVYVYSGPPSLT